MIDGKNADAPALAASLRTFLTHLQENIQDDVDLHNEDPDWLANINTAGEEVETYLKVLEPWVPSCKADSIKDLKDAMVRMFVVSRPLADSMVKVRLQPNQVSSNLGGLTIATDVGVSCLGSSPESA